MPSPANTERYENYRLPAEIISHGVWLYDRFTLSYRDVQELLCERGIDVTDEAIRQWCLKFEQDYANRLRHRRPQPGDTWHLDLVTTRPFPAPHQILSDSGRIGGGPVPRPGEVSRAHHGVRFLDELPECRRHVLEVLRQPLDDRMVIIARASLVTSSLIRLPLPARL